MSTPGLTVLRAANRFRSTTPDLDVRHAFSTGPHYDPGRTSHGVLVVCDEALVQPGPGFAPHRHRDVEIVSWVLEGALRHEDSTGWSGVVRAGTVQRTSAGHGVVHSERSATAGPVRFVQMQVVADEPGDPGYDAVELAVELGSERLVVVASGLPAQDAPLRLRNRSAALHAARLPAGSSVGLPDAPHLHLQVVQGAVVVEPVGRLDAGDALQTTAAGPQRVTAAAPAELLVWEMHADLRGGTMPA